MSVIEVRQATFAMMNVTEVSRREANQLLEKWEHPLGPISRPFGQQGWVLDIMGEPAAVAVSASTVSKSVSTPYGGRYLRENLVELGRIGRSPEHPHIMRVMLRLWRAYLAHQWPYGKGLAALLSYAMPGTLGDIYRFDGWENWGRCEVSRGGGTWTYKDPAVSRIDDGIKTRWGWPLRCMSNDGLGCRIPHAPCICPSGRAESQGGP